MEEIAEHDALAGLDRARDALLLAAEGMERGYALSDGESRGAVERAAAVVAAAHAVYLQTIRNLDVRGDAVPDASSGSVAKTFLVHRVHVDPGTAKGLVAAAHSLDGDTGDLPLVGAALAEGEITFEHAQVCVKAASRLPKALKTCTVTDEASGETVSGIQAVDRVLAGTITDQTVRSVRWLTDGLVSLLDPGRTERFDEDAHLRRGIHLSVDSTGMGVLKATLPPADTVRLQALLSAWGRPDPGTRCTVEGDDGTVQETLVRDERTVAMRRYDAFIAALLAVGGTGLDVDLRVTATVEQVSGLRGAGKAYLDRVGPIGQRLFGLLACSATLTRVLVNGNGVPVDVGRASRLATPAQRKALAVRDGGCVVPGCTVPAAGCAAHHVVAWTEDGPTDLDNLALACWRHHQGIHAGIWAVEFRDGIPWIRPPSWVDPQQRLRRNPLHHHGSAVQRLAEQLTLALTEDHDGEAAA